MAVTYIVTGEDNYAILCLAADTKPDASSGAICFETDTGFIYKNVASVWTLVPFGGVAVWGTITGTLSSQTDLQSALDGKQDSGNYATGGGIATGTNTGDQTLPTDATIVTTDVTTNNATTSKHGWLQKLPGGTSTFLRADGAFAAPTASVAIYQTEIDFGSVPLKMKKFTITDAGVTASMKIIPTMSYDNPSDGEEDSVEWFEDLILMARADTGQFFLYASSPYQDLNGKVKINYIYA